MCQEDVKFPLQLVALKSNVSLQETLGSLQPKSTLSECEDTLKPLVLPNKTYNYIILQEYRLNLALVHSQF